MTSKAAPIRVLQLTSTSDLGGAEAMVMQLVQALQRPDESGRGGFEPVVASLVGGGELIDRARAAGVPAEHLEFRSPFDPRGIVRLHRLIRKHRIDVVQTHGLRADSAGRIVARLAGARAVISTIHSIDPWRRRRHVFLDRLTSGWVSRWVAVCEAAKAATVARERFPASRIDVVPIGIEPRPVSREHMETTRAALGIPAEAGPVVGIVANLREMKGHRDVLAALPEIRKKHPQIVFVFAGKDTSDGAIEREAQAAHLLDAIRFPGFVADVPGLLGALDIFCLPSHWEGLPVSIIEAMHAGLAIIATNVGGIPELIRHGQEGLLIPPKNPAALAAAVDELATNWAKRTSLGRAALQRAITDFTVSAMARRMEAIYRQELGQGA
jgi:glycosyltransferase involved in cell wall biosynthesis